MVQQGSVLGQSLFNVFLNDLLMFSEKTVIFNFADDNTLSSSGKECHIIMNKHEVSIISKWFKVYSLKANPGKFQYMILGNHQQNFVTLKVNSIEIRETSKVALLGITINNKVTFNEKKIFIFRAIKKVMLCFYKQTFQLCANNLGVL